jgi:beta-lactam-binding protein with PASTA domain/predicted Ser/Thr protein kinase
MAVSDTLINTVFDGRYRVLRKLGSGGMANVYLAEDGELGRQVAIKILNDRHAADDQFVERFRREAKNAAGLSHPNIVQIYDRGEAEGTYYIAMEYLEGQTLKELAGVRGPLPVRDAIAYARQILAALRFAHRKGIVHRDIKPHNALIDDDGRLKVTDFGIARAGPASQMTEAGSIIGTAQYLSPEQARGGAIDQRSDLYSVGVVLYELLTGTVPFTGDTPVEIAMKHLSSVPEPPSARRAEIPRPLDQVVLRALAKDPDERYASAEEMDAELARVAEGLPVSTETAEAATAVLAGAGVTDTAATAVVRRPAPPPPRTYAPPPSEYYYEPPQRRRRPIWPWLLALLLLVAAGFAGWFAFQTIEDRLESELVAVPNVVGLEEILAVRRLMDRDLVPDVRRERDEEVPRGKVISQDPEPGDRVPRDNQVVLRVSEGPPTTEVPDVEGRSATDAVSILKDAGLDANVESVPSREPEGTIIAQHPAAGETVRLGTSVRINASKGPELVIVPSVVGDRYEDALATLQRAGFAVARTDVDNEEAPRGIVVGQNPGEETSQPRGSRITLSVSKGPTTVEVPDVLGFQEDAARSTLEGEGFGVRVRRQEVSTPEEADIVLDQFPAPGETANPGSFVSIIVGFFVEEEPPPPGE